MGEAPELFFTDEFTSGLEALFRSTCKSSSIDIFFTCLDSRSNLKKNCSSKKGNDVLFEY